MAGDIASRNPISKYYDSNQRGIAAFTGNFFRMLLRNKLKVAIVLLLFIAYVNMTQAVTALFIIAILVLIGGFSTFYKLWVKLSFGFELVTMSTVICAMLYGPLVGAFAGLVSAILAEYIPQMIEASSIPWMTSTALSGAIVAIVWAAFHPPILVLGLLSFVIQIAISEPIRLMGPPEVKMQGYLYIGTGLIWNIFVFTKIAPYVYAFLT